MSRQRDPKRDPGDTPVSRVPPPAGSHDDAGTRQETPAPDTTTPRPPAREPGPPPITDSEVDAAHEGATEEQVGDRTGPGVGFDEDFKRSC